MNHSQKFNLGLKHNRALLGKIILIEKVVGHIYNVLKGQVLSPVKVCEESEVTTNIQLYEIKQMSFTIKLYL